MNREIINNIEKLGIVTFPVKKNTKFPNVPKGHMKDVYDGKVDPIPISDDDNYGVICGKNGLLVIDLDKSTLINEFTKDLEKLKENTVIVESGKGHHIYINCPDAKNIKVFRGDDEIDLKGPGGYCVGPGSYVIPPEKDKHKYPVEKQDGFEYKL